MSENPADRALKQRGGIRSHVRILIVKLSAIGDVVHSLPLLEVLKANFPHASIDWVVEEAASNIVKGHWALDRVVVFPRTTWIHSLKRGGERLTVFADCRRFVRSLRNTPYDLVVDLQGLFRSGVLTGLSSGTRKIGLAGSREGARLFVSEPPVPVRYDVHAIERYLRVADHLGCRPFHWDGCIPVFERNKAVVKSLLESRGLGEKPLIALNPMAKWDSKLWSLERFAQLADRIHDEERCHVVLTGSGADREALDEIARLSRREHPCLAGHTTLKDLAHLYSQCAAVVSTDTGPMHIAAAMGCPVVGIFGPTSARRTGPYGAAHRVVRARVECRPCFKKTCTSHVCMNEISVDMVMRELRRVLGHGG